LQLMVPIESSPVVALAVDPVTPTVKIELCCVGDAANAPETTLAFPLIVQAPRTVAPRVTLCVIGAARVTSDAPAIASKAKPATEYVLRMVLSSSVKEFARRKPH
jgi:hypothetical protein